MEEQINRLYLDYILLSAVERFSIRLWTLEIIKLECKQIRVAWLLTGSWAEEPSVLLPAGRTSAYVVMELQVSRPSGNRSAAWLASRSVGQWINSIGLEVTDTYYCRSISMSHNEFCWRGRLFLVAHKIPIWYHQHEITLLESFWNSHTIYLLGPLLWRLFFCGCPSQLAASVASKHCKLGNRATAT